MNVAESCKAHADHLEITTDEGLESILANASLNPKAGTIHHWYSIWRKLKLGTRSGPELIAVKLHLFFLGQQTVQTNSLNMNEYSIFFTGT